MSDSLPALEAQRAAIQQQISQLGDMRSGSISTTGGRSVTRAATVTKRTIPVMVPFIGSPAR